MRQTPRQGHPRPSNPMSGVPPRRDPGQPRHNYPPHNYAPGPGLNSHQPPRKKSTTDRNADPRASQYSASLYSTGDSPKASPEAPQMPSFSDMQASLRRYPSNGRSLKRASSMYTDNPFMDTVVEHPDESRPRSLSSDASSGQFSVYRPEKGGVISPFDGEPKGLDGIIAGSNNLQPDQGLVRQASLGKRQKAALTNVRYSEHKSIAPSVRDDPDAPPTPPEDQVKAGGHPPQNSFNQMVPPPLSPSRLPGNSSSKAPFDDRFRTQQDRPPKTPSPKLGGSWPLRSPAVPNATKSPLSPPKSRFSREYKPSHSNNSSSGEGGKLFLMPQRQRSLKDRVGDKAPTSINMEAVRDAEARGSMTSLPGLLNRALQMASNLEKGKTSSKHGSDWFGNGVLKEMSGRGKSTASLDGMLDRFAFSPTVGDKKDRGSSAFSEKWPRPAPLPPSGLHQQMSNTQSHETQYRSRSKYDHRRRAPKRRCCGMPLWLFFMLLITALVLIVLAVVLPIALIVIPNDKKSAPDDSCQTKHPCQNGGVSLPDGAGQCRCICTRSFTGAQCATANNPSSCGSLSVPGVPNAAIGSKLPPLITNSQSQYQIPLNGSAIITAFSIAETNCDIQNTLVSFNKNSAKKRQVGRNDVLATSTSTTDGLPPSITAPPSSPHRGPVHQHDLRQDQAVTQGGLVVAGSVTSAAPTQSTSSPSSGSGSSQFADARHMDFAKTAILYTLQSSQQLSVAVTAAQRLMPYFNDLGMQGDPKDVDIGYGLRLDLVAMVLSGGGDKFGASGSTGNP